MVELARIELASKCVHFGFHTCRNLSQPHKLPPKLDGLTTYILTSEDSSTAPSSIAEIRAQAVLLYRPIR